MWAFWRRKPAARPARKQSPKAGVDATPAAAHAEKRDDAASDPVKNEVERLRETLKKRPEAALAVLRQWLREEDDRTLH